MKFSVLISSKNKRNWRAKYNKIAVKKIFRIFLIFLVCVSVVFLFALVETYQTFQALKKIDLSDAAFHANLAQIITRPLAAASLHSIPDLELWQSSLRSISLSSDLIKNVQAYIPLTLQSDMKSVRLAQNIRDESNILSEMALRMMNSFLRSVIARPIIFHFFPRFSNLDSSLENIRAINQSLQFFLTGHHRMIILFQNSDELRATGGFMGSYADIELNNGFVSPILIQDIYQPDGQFHDFVPAPAGLREYLSSGHGMRLPDSNWSPDFPTSAQNILGFFTAIDERDIDTVVALNVSVTEKILQEVGDVYVPDFNVHVTAQNFADVARADRKNFFPGSQEKKNFLSAFFTVLKLKLEQLSIREQIKIADILWDASQHKEIQIYSTDAGMENMLQSNEAAGQVIDPTHFDNVTPLFLIESNVGINKANHGVGRDVSIDAQDYQTTLSLHFKNKNTVDEENKPLHYVDYQRIYVPLTFQLDSIQIGDADEKNLTDQIFTSASGEKLREIGFLVTVPAQSEQTVRIQFHHPALNMTDKPLFIPRQPGLPPTPYTIQYNGQSKSFILEKDELVLFGP